MAAYRPTRPTYNHLRTSSINVYQKIRRKTTILTHIESFFLFSSERLSGSALENHLVPRVLSPSRLVCWPPAEKRHWHHLVSRASPRIWDIDCHNSCCIISVIFDRSWPIPFSLSPRIEKTTNQSYSILV